MKKTILMVLIHNLEIAWPTKISINAIYEFLGQFASRCIIIFSKSVDIFEIAPKTYKF